MLNKHLLVLLIISSVMIVQAYKRRKPKFLSFNTLEGDVAVDLEFSIPFISIPVKKTMENTFGDGLGFPTVNVNTAALALGGAVVLGTAVIIPYVIKTATQSYPNNYGRFFDNAQFGSDNILTFANHFMSDGRVWYQCTMKIACWTGRSNSTNDSMKILNQVSRADRPQSVARTMLAENLSPDLPHTNRNTPYQKIWYLTTVSVRKGGCYPGGHTMGPTTMLYTYNQNDILSAMFNTTAMEEAAMTGRMNNDCSKYDSCPIRDEHMPYLISTLTNYGK